MPHPLSRFDDEYCFLFRWDRYPKEHQRRSMKAHAFLDAARIALETANAWAPMQTFRQERGAHAADVLKTITAGAALHLSGHSSSLTQGTPDLNVSDSNIASLKSTFNALWDHPEEGPRTDSHPTANAFGLSLVEQQAVAAYSSPHKNNPMLDEHLVNHYYMGKAYGGFANGWDALTSALNKLPSFGDLGLTMATFRVTRDDTETSSLANMRIGDRLVLGLAEMGMKQRHVASTSITYSVHLSPQKVADAGGMLAFFGASGVFINWLGVMSMSTDGGEVLYRPGTIMQLSAVVPGGYAGKYPIFVLEEIPSFSESDLTRTRYFDDFTFQRVRNGRLISDVRVAGQQTDILGLLS